MRPSLIITLIALVALALAWFLAWPLVQDVNSSRERVASLERAVRAEREANERLLKLALEIEERGDAVTTLERSVTVERDIASLVAVFEEAASVNGLLLESIVFRDSRAGDESVTGPTGPAFESVTSDLALTGTYPAIDSFLADVERSFPLIDVASVSFEQEEETGQGASVSANPTFRFTVVFTSYYLR